MIKLQSRKMYRCECGERSKCVGWIDVEDKMLEVFYSFKVICVFSWGD